MSVSKSGDDVMSGLAISAWWKDHHLAWPGWGTSLQGILTQGSSVDMGDGRVRLPF